MMSSQEPSTLQLARCAECGGYTFPATAYGCRVCGAASDRLQAVPCPTVPRLRNAVTVHAELAPGLPVPCVIGEVELAPGVVEEALIEAASEGELTLGMALRARAVSDPAGKVQWRFAPDAREDAQ
jgi:uncharacterized OB-fold protein